jgi:UDP-N-acetylmuramyl pentapeptide phosphotransferase/UDP-N-acetylglucosamine-1-phosphate transferase
MSGSGTIPDWASPFGWIVLVAAAAAVSYGLLLLLSPLLQRHALAHPNARSSHKTPTPQGGGYAVIATTVGVAGVASIALGDGFGNHSLWLVLAATVLIAAVGAWDDARPIAALPRLFLQAAAAAIVLAALPGELHFVPSLPHWLERTLIGVALLWFVNLTNFMDGIDWMTVAEVVPLTAGLVLFGLMGALPRDATVVALALAGATIGFAPFNRPVARLFLGDVGSLPIGLLLGWLLVLLAGNGHLAAALLQPLYYLADATITLLRRLVSGEPALQAHRSHFYQRAMDGNFSVYQIVARVFLLNVALVGLAATTLLTPSYLFHAGALVAGCILVALLLYRFAAAKA